MRAPHLPEKPTLCSLYLPINPLLRAKPFLLLILLLSILPPLHSQYTPQNQVPNDIYSFLSELHPNPTLPVKPLSRTRILEMLEEIDPLTLNTRQQKELAFYLKDFNKEKYTHKNFSRRRDMLYLRDSTFSLTINPILGGTYWNSREGSIHHWWNGIYASASTGNWSFFASLTDNHESEELMHPDFLTQRQGGANFKLYSDGKQDYWDSRGGVTYAWKTGHIGIIKDNFSWGSGYNGTNIFSGRTPSFVHLNLNIRPVKWFEFNYVHGWLVSEVADSSRSFYYNRPDRQSYRIMYHSKFIAANLFTFKPLRGLNISAGNSIVYDYDNIHPAYLIPILFYKPVDHHLQSGVDNMNSMMFMDISTTIIPRTHLYFTAFVDEMAVNRFFNPDEFNFLSYKGGIRIFNLIPNTYAGAEYTWTNALTYRHYVPTLTFESNRYNLGHYLEDNSRELYLTAGFKPFRGLDLNFSYTHAEKGPDHTLLGTRRVGIVPFSPKVWEYDALCFNANWQVINDVWIYLGYTHQENKGEQEYVERYMPAFWQGKKGAVNFGVRIGRN